MMGTVSCSKTYREGMSWAENIPRFGQAENHPNEVAAEKFSRKNTKVRRWWPLSHGKGDLFSKKTGLNKVEPRKCRPFIGGLFLVVWFLGEEKHFNGL